MLDDDVEDPDTVVDQNLKLLLGSFGGVPARQDGPVQMRGAFGQTVALGRCDDLLAARAQDGDVCTRESRLTPRRRASSPPVMGAPCWRRNSRIRRRRLPAEARRGPSSDSFFGDLLSGIIFALSCQL